MKRKYPENLIGLKFGRLTVVRRSIIKNSHSHWICKCECGKTKVIPRPNLVSKGTQSCGCIKAEQNAKGRKQYGYSNAVEVFNQYKAAAKRRNMSFELTFEEFCAIVKNDCVYCGSKPANIRIRKDRFGEFIYNGIDRIDSKRGYDLDNITACCTNCNYMKSDLTKEDFLKHISAIFNKSLKEN